MSTHLPIRAWVYDAQIRWCTDAELDALEPPMSDAVKWYCRTALREA